MGNPVTIHDIIALDGRRVTGASPDSTTVIEQKLRASGKSWCAVSAWLIIDVGEGAAAENLPAPLLPMVLFAHYVQMHSSGRLQMGDSVMSGYATLYRGEDGIFETADTVFVLMGRGFRKSVDAQTLKAAMLRWA